MERLDLAVVTHLNDIDAVERHCLPIVGRELDSPMESCAVGCDEDLIRCSGNSFCFGEDALYELTDGIAPGVGWRADRSLDTPSGANASATALASRAPVAAK